jgi:hypothetical protein
MERPYYRTEQSKDVSFVSPRCELCYGRNPSVKSDHSREHLSGQSGAFSNCGFSGRWVCLETGVGGVTGGVLTHQMSCVALDLLV